LPELVLEALRTQRDVDFFSGRLTNRQTQTQAQCQAQHFFVQIHCVPPKRENKETDCNGYNLQLAQRTTLIRLLQAERRNCAFATLQFPIFVPYFFFRMLSA
jgi:hypothetical protein